MHWAMVADSWPPPTAGSVGAPVAIGGRLSRIVCCCDTQKFASMAILAPSGTSFGMTRCARIA